MDGNISERINRLEDRCRNYKLQVLNVQREYKTWTERKSSVIAAWSVHLAELYTLLGKDVKEVAGDIIEQLQEINCIEGGFNHVYKCIKDEYKNENAKQLFKRYSLSNDKGQKLNVSKEEEAIELGKEIKEIFGTLPKSRVDKLKEHLKEELLEEVPEEEPVKEEDFGVHQAEPQKGMQGPSEFSDAIRFTALWFKTASERMTKIAEEVETYKPQNKERIEIQAKDWNTCINGTIIQKILNPIFMVETKAEADRKYSTSIAHWIDIIKNRIEQSKHGAGKMAENSLLDPFGKPVYNKKGKLIKKSISRERVGDFEWPIVDMAAELISANLGMMQLHDWLENDQGGYRRYRKEFLHDYFAEASMGSIKSGNPEYEQFMREYKKKQLEKFKSQ